MNVSGELDTAIRLDRPKLVCPIELYEVNLCNLFHICQVTKVNDETQPPLWFVNQKVGVKLETRMGRFG